MSQIQDTALYGALLGDDEIAASFRPEAEIAALIEVERGLARAGAAIGLVPEGVAEVIDRTLAGVTVTPGMLGPGTARAGVAVPPLVEVLRAALPPEAAHWLHWGATSQDIADCALVLRLRDMLERFDTRLARLIDALAATARAHAGTAMAGRTRTQIATPVSFGLRVAQWAMPLADLRAELGGLRTRLLRVQLGGASGANTALGAEGPALQAALGEALGLAPGPPWHTNRVAIAGTIGWLAAVAAAAGRIGGDLLVLTRREIAEVSLDNAGGSSTMPNKTNPVRAEAAVALARHAAMLSAGGPAAMLHTEERDGAAWMLEWLVLPPVAVSAGAALGHAAALADDMVPDARRMGETLLADGGAVFAETASFVLARHMPRPEAQALVKAAALRARQEGRGMIAVLAETPGLDPAVAHAIEAEAGADLGQRVLDDLLARLERSDPA